MAAETGWRKLIADALMGREDEDDARKFDEAYGRDVWGRPIKD